MYRSYVVFCILCFGVEGSGFSMKDFTMIGLFSEKFHSDNLIFVENVGDVTVVKKCQELLGMRYYYSSFNSTVLERILRNDTLQRRLFQKRTVIITEERLNLSGLLDEVLLPHYVTWLIFIQYEMKEIFYIPASCNVIFVNSGNEPITAERVYHLRQGTEPVRITWSLDVPESKKEIFNPQKKINLRNVTLNLHVLYGREVCHQQEGTMLKKLNCIHQNLLMLMGSRLNYSINFVECKEKEYPYSYPNGTDSELFVKLKNREVDFSSASHVVRSVQKRQFMDYVWPTFVLKSMMYLKQARLAGRWASYLKPLEPSVWWCILCSVVITGVFVKVFEKFLANNFKFDLWFFYEVAMSTFRALQVFCNQAVVDLSTSYSIRLLYVLKFFVVLVFFQAYCGYLVSSLTVVVARFPFTDLKGFLENQQYRIMTLQKGFHRYYFGKVILEGKNDTFMLPENELPETIQEAVNKLCTEDYLAFTEFREDLLNFGKLNCRISELPTPMVHLYVGIGIHKKTPLKEYLKRELLHLHSTGIIRRMGRYLSTHSDFRDSNTSGQYSTVSLMHVFPIFILLYTGIGISLLIFCVEVIVKKNRSSLVKNRKSRFHRERMISGYM